MPRRADYQFGVRDQRPRRRSKAIDSVLADSQDREPARCHAIHRCSPSPCGRGSRGGGTRQRAVMRPQPLPRPLPQGEGGRGLRVLILGGTGEASALARLLADDGRFAPVLSLAGRTATPAASPIPRRIGGFGGADGLAAFLRAERIAALVDATHPFARADAAQCARGGGARRRPHPAHRAAGLDAAARRPLDRRGQPAGCRARRSGPLPAACSSRSAGRSWRRSWRPPGTAI